MARLHFNCRASASVCVCVSLCVWNCIRVKRQMRPKHTKAIKDTFYHFINLSYYITCSYTHGVCMCVFVICDGFSFLLLLSILKIVNYSKHINTINTHTHSVKDVCVNISLTDIDRKTAKINKMCIRWAERLITFNVDHSV